MVTSNYNVQGRFNRFSIIIMSQMRGQSSHMFNVSVRLLPHLLLHPLPLQFILLSSRLEQVGAGIAARQAQYTMISFRSDSCNVQSAAQHTSMISLGRSEAACTRTGLIFLPYFVMSNKVEPAVIGHLHVFLKFSIKVNTASKRTALASMRGPNN